jgi:adenosylhomocysteinase
VNYDVKDLSLAAAGRNRIEWAAQDMPVLDLIHRRFARERPLAGVRLAACLHITTETANLLSTLQAGGAQVVACASNPLSTQDDVAASLVQHEKIPVFAIKGENTKTYYRHIHAALEFKPRITMDDGADLVSTITSKRRGLIPGILGGTEETTTGVIRLKSMEKKGVLAYPIIAVNDAKTKHLFDNRYGTGQSTLDGIIRATNRLIAGRTVVVSGYGWCGRGVAMRAHGLGGNIIIVEVDPIKALEAVMDGYRVLPIAQAARVGDIFVTLTGNINVIRYEHFLKMKDGAIVANSGHFNVELQLDVLRKRAKQVRNVRPYVEEFTLSNGRRINALGEGRLINLAAAEGHPASVMDMSFANQALSAEFVVKNARRLERKVYPVPAAIDEKIAALKLRSLGVAVDTLTPEQKRYLSSWELGT